MVLMLSQKKSRIVYCSRIKAHRRVSASKVCEIIASDRIQNLSINNCNIEGMTINGLLVSELINIYKATCKSKDNSN